MSNKGRDLNSLNVGLSPRHRADIDGLRAVAILGVLTYHFALGVPGGYGGVDVFFVISGFLIAGIIKGELDTGTFSLAKFYARRIRRILPALVVCMLVTTVFSAFLLFPTDFVMFGKSLRDVALSISNFFFMRMSVSYFGTGMHENPVLHTWSLGIEEQFYAVVPFLLVTLFRVGRRFILPATAVLAFISFLISVRGVADYPQQAFFSTAGRVWELFTGVLLAFGLVPPIKNRTACEIAAAIGIALIAFGYFAYTESTPFPGVAALPFCLGAALVIHSAGGTQSTAVARLLSVRLATRIGLISYSVYLWHWPLLALMRYRFPQWFETDGDERTIVAVILFLLSLGSGFLSWKFIEQPFRTSNPQRLRGSVFACGGTAVAALIAVAYLIVSKPDVLQRWSPEIASLAATKMELQDPGLFGRAIEVPGGITGAVYEVGQANVSSHVLLWGDSHALALLPEFAAYATKSDVRAFAAPHAGCPPLLDIEYPRTKSGRACQILNNNTAKIAFSPMVHTVVLVGRWAAVAAGVHCGDDGKPLFTGTGSDQGDGLSMALASTIHDLLAHDKKVILVGPIPELPFDLFATMARHKAWGQPLPPEPLLIDFLDRQKRILPLLAKFSRLPHVNVEYPHELLCGRIACPYAKAGVPSYIDRDHLSPAGAAQLEPLFRNIFHETSERDLSRAVVSH